MKEYLKSHSSEILAKFRRISSLINHSLSIGRFHEEIIVNFIRGFLSNRYSLKTGFVIDVDTKERSNQTDILIIDENVPNPYVFQEKDFCLARPRAVVCGIEIKSKLDKKNFCGSVLAAKNFRSVCKRSQFLVFSFSSIQTILNRAHSWYQDINTVEDDILYYPSLISCLDFGCLLLMPQNYASSWGHYPLIKTDPKQNIEEVVLAFFLSTVIKIVDGKAGVSSNPYGEYMNYGLLLLHECYRYGIGKKVGSPIGRNN